VAETLFCYSDFNYNNDANIHTQFCVTKLYQDFFEMSTVPSLTEGADTTIQET